MSWKVREGDFVTVMQSEASRFTCVEPRPVFLRVEKVGRKYVSGVVNHFDSERNQVVENNRYSTKFDMGEYMLLSTSFDVELAKRFNEHGRELQEFKQKEADALRNIDWTERQKYYDAKGLREAQWREANPQPVFKV